MQCKKKNIFAELIEKNFVIENEIPENQEINAIPIMDIFPQLWLVVVAEKIDCSIMKVNKSITRELFGCCIYYP